LKVLYHRLFTGNNPSSIAHPLIASGTNPGSGTFSLVMMSEIVRVNDKQSEKKTNG
jgi:hypothetical protein